jgi:hypothetical protein
VTEEWAIRLQLGRHRGPEIPVDSEKVADQQCEKVADYVKLARRAPGPWEVRS